MNTKQVSQLDDNGYFIGVTIADESPLEPGVFLLPRNTFDIDAPVIPEGKVAKLADGAWLIEDFIQPDQRQEARQIDYSAMRLNAYRIESDPLFFKSQRGEVTQQEWIDKVNEIKQRWPDIAVGTL